MLNHLRNREFTMEGEYVMVAGWPVQLLPPTGHLIEEALDQAAQVDVEGEPARVFSAEHLAAICLQTGRAKDMARLLQFLESGVLDLDRFEGIITHHGLDLAWQKFRDRFLEDTP